MVRKGMTESTRIITRDSTALITEPAFLNFINEIAKRLAIAFLR